MLAHVFNDIDKPPSSSFRNRWLSWIHELYIYNSDVSEKKLLSPPFVIKRWLEKFHQTNLVRGFSSQLPSFLNEFLGDRWSLPLCAHMRCPSSQGHLPVEERQWMGQTSKLSADGLRNLKKSQEFEISPYQSQYILYLNCLWWSLFWIYHRVWHLAQLRNDFLLLEPLLRVFFMLKFLGGRSRQLKSRQLVCLLLMAPRIFGWFQSHHSRS